MFRNMKGGSMIIVKYIVLRYKLLIFLTYTAFAFFVGVV